MERSSTETDKNPDVLGRKIEKRLAPLKEARAMASRNNLPKSQAYRVLGEG
ncbi:hypothetical protein [Algoriphagus boritolerans]|uniref:hypothetical protein n=1 Tax=Algoriphagus boritolerans TaxID=308111 RepID=UPI000AF09657|nr:hypothetical protein [Algoriphagus boritolerans]